MPLKKLVFRLHALQRMFQRDISNDDVKRTIESGEVIENYPNDEPYPSQLTLGFVNDRPIHVVFAENSEENEIIIITVYEPNPTKWEQDFKRRIKP